MPAVLRDASFVIGNLNPDDRAEVMCQVSPATKTHELAYAMLMSSDSYVAKWKGRPAMFFGVNPLNICALSIWALGTRQSWRTIPELTAFVAHTVLPRKIDEGFTTMEARSIMGHTVAHGWMEATGAVRSGDPFVYGRGGELFQLFRWTVTEYHSRTAQIRKPT